VCGRTITAPWPHEARERLSNWFDIIRTAGAGFSRVRETSAIGAATKVIQPMISRPVITCSDDRGHNMAATISEDKLEAIWEDFLCLYKITYSYWNKIKFTKETNAKFAGNSTTSATAKRSSILHAYGYGYDYRNIGIVSWRVFLAVFGWYLGFWGWVYD